MSDSKEVEIQQELEKISQDIKSIMKKVEELYPKEPGGEKSDAPETDTLGKPGQDGES